MRFRLCTLLIVLALGPLVLAFSWSKYSQYRARQLVIPDYSGIAGATDHGRPQGMTWEEIAKIRERQVSQKNGRNVR
jgi:hypothetical protein